MSLFPEREHPQEGVWSSQRHGDQNGARRKGEVMRDKDEGEGELGGT